jgi:hypothetical protein
MVYWAASSSSWKNLLSRRRMSPYQFVLHVLLFVLLSALDMAVCEWFTESA